MTDLKTHQKVFCVLQKVRLYEFFINFNMLQSYTLCFLFYNHRSTCMLEQIKGEDATECNKLLFEAGQLMCGTSLKPMCTFPFNKAS